VEEEEKEKEQDEKKTQLITMMFIIYRKFSYAIFFIKVGHSLPTQAQKYTKKNYCTRSCLNLNEI
jgi:hypothetical protein